MAWSLAASPPRLPPAPPPPLQPRLRGVALPTRRCRRRRAARSRGQSLSTLLGCRKGRRATVSAALPEEVAEGTTTDRSSSSGSSKVSSVRTQLDLLEQLTSGSEYESAEDPYTPSVRDQLTDLADGRVGDFNIPLGKKLIVSINSLTISQRRNIKRQAYLNEVSQRNDTRFFATVGAFVLLPPAIILAVAILTGYVQLSP
uniref:HEAT repeat-containing protein 6 n=1 Tax=Anthurium amnicola TaxID=1678845 RepID=A0A1D1YTT7_9ARAE